jgi:hypothetical protein
MKEEWLAESRGARLSDAVAPPRDYSGSLEQDEGLLMGSDAIRSNDIFRLANTLEDAAGLGITRRSKV